MIFSFDVKLIYLNESNVVGCSLKDFLKMLDKAGVSASYHDDPKPVVKMYFNEDYPMKKNSRERFIDLFQEYVISICKIQFESI